MEKDLLIAFERSLLEEVKIKEQIKSVSEKEVIYSFNAYVIVIFTQVEEETTKEKEKYEVETILKKKSLKCGKFNYLIKWKGYTDPKDNTWEPASSIPNDLVSAFEGSLSDMPCHGSKRKPKQTEKYKSYYKSRKNDVTEKKDATKKSTGSG